MYVMTASVAANSKIQCRVCEGRITGGAGSLAIGIMDAEHIGRACEKQLLLSAGGRTILPP
jgi:hypothetical protein